MTNEDFEKSKKIKQQIERLYDYKRTLLPFISERVEIKISWEKGIYSYTPDEETHREITLYSDDPMVKVLSKALNTMIGELESQFEEIGKVHPKEQPTPQEQIMPKKSWWKRIWKK